MILDCSCPESAKKSLCEIFDVAEAKLLTLIRSVKPYDSDFQPPEDVIYDQVCEQFGVPNSPIQITWFHGTRVEDHNLFYKHGILPKTAAKSFIEPRLRELAADLERSGNNPFSTSLMGKQGEHDEGPFAFLIKDVAIHAPGAHHSYVKVPEMVEDISGILLGENFSQLVARYQKITTSYVVTFIADSKGYEIPYALWYLKLIEDGESEIKAANAANTCFCGDGSIIPSGQIQNVEHI